jgi:hypothetical protein
MDPKREAYPFAGALSVTAGNLLAQVHESAGAPPSADASEWTADQRTLWAAAGRAYGAIAACSAVAARLLLIEKEALRQQVPEVGVPQRFELGATTLEASEARAWAATVRAAAAARGELAGCLSAWVDLPGADRILRLTGQLIDYVDELAAVFERIEPL